MSFVDSLPSKNPFFTQGGSEASRRKAICTIVVNGQDVTDRLEPHLISVTVTDKGSGSSDTCAIELDDRDARLEIPPDNGIVEVWIGWHSESQYQIFEGFVKEVESGFSRKQGGRRLWIDAFGVNASGDVATPKSRSWGEGAPPGQAEGTKVPLSQVLKDAAKAAGIDMHIGSEFDGIARDYWAQNSSFMDFATGIAKQTGASFKITGNKAAFVSPFSTNGMATITAIWGKNLLEWRIKPFVGRPQAKEAETKYYDLQKSIWEKTTAAIGGSTPFGRASRTASLPAPAPNANVGEQTNQGMSTDSQTNRGQGWVLINGEPQARHGSTLIIDGARPGVNGTYQVKEAEHHYTRGGGYVTRCELQNPAPDVSGYGSWPRNQATEPAPNTQ